MRYRFLLLPHTGTWTLATTLDADLLPDDTILLDPLHPQPARRMRVLWQRDWCALTEQDVDRLGVRDLPPLPTT